MKRLLFIAMLFIACTQVYAQTPTLTITNNIPGSALRIKVIGQSLPSACNSSISDFIPISYGVSWTMATPYSLPLSWPAPISMPFAYDAVYFEVLGGGGSILCYGTVGKPLCTWSTNVPIPCLFGRFATWTSAPGIINVNFH